MPDPQQDCEIELWDHSEGYVSSSTLRDEAHHVANNEKGDDAKIIVAETLRGSHALVSSADQELQGADVDQDGLIITSDDRALDIRVAKCNLRRSLLIMDALLNALMQRGNAVEAGPTIEILDERLHIGIWEVLEVEKVEPEEHNLTGVPPSNRIPDEEQRSWAFPRASTFDAASSEATLVPVGVRIEVMGWGAVHGSDTDDLRFRWGAASKTSGAGRREPRPAAAARRPGAQVQTPTIAKTRRIYGYGCLGSGLVGAPCW